MSCNYGALASSDPRSPLHRALLQLTERLKVPVVSSGADASDLSASDLFARTNPPYMSYAYATADITRHTGLTSVGAVISPAFADGIGVGFAKAVESRNMTTPCGVTVIRSKDTRILAQNLDKMAAVGCRAILAVNCMRSLRTASLPYHCRLSHSI